MSKQEVRLCKVCGFDFNPHDPRHKGGYINICGSCDGEDVTRAIGVLSVGGKSDYEVEILMNPEPATVAFVKRQGRAYATTCQTSMQLNSNGSSPLAQKEKPIKE